MNFHFALCILVSRICTVRHGVIEKGLSLAKFRTGAKVKIDWVTLTLILCVRSVYMCPARKATRGEFMSWSGCRSERRSSNFAGFGFVRQLLKEFKVVRKWVGNAPFRATLRGHCAIVKEFPLVKQLPRTCRCAKRSGTDAS